MKTIRLGPSEIETTNIGFGCAQICRLPSKKQQHRVLASVFDQGVRHFDVARMYGLGAAESSLGEFLANRRNQVVIATKFGIPIHNSSKLVAPLQKIARLAVRTFPNLRKVAQRNRENIYLPKDFGIEFAEKCLHQSLRALKTDYLDVFLLHEPGVEDTIPDQIVEWLEKLQVKGVIREYGMSGKFADIMTLTLRIPGLRRVTQFPSDVFNQNIIRYEPIPGEGLVTFSGLSLAIDHFRQTLASQDQRLDSFPAPFDTQANLISGFARYVMFKNCCMNPRGVTLFSSTREAGVSDLINAALAEPEFPDTVLGFFDRVVANRTEI